VVDGVVQRGGVRGRGGLVVEPCRQLFDAAYGVAQRAQRGREHLADGAVVAERRLLAEQHEVGGSGGRLERAGHPGVLGQPPCDGAEHGRLAGAVLADQADAPPRLGDELDAGEHRAVTEGDGQVADDDGAEGRHAGVLTLTSRGLAGLPESVQPRARVRSGVHPHDGARVTNAVSQLKTTNQCEPASRQARPAGHADSAP
jgi:hypothetical protein